MAEITNTGFVAKTQNDYFSQEQQLYLDIDPAWNLDPSTPDGLKIAHDAEIFSLLDEVAQEAYNSKDPDKVRDLELDYILALNGLKRNSGTPSIVPVRFRGTPLTSIPTGTRIKSRVDDSIWLTDSELIIGNDGVIVGTATRNINGALAADADTITIIMDTIGGITSVTNFDVATIGTDDETNGAARLRRKKSFALAGNNQVDSMRAAILDVADVVAGEIYENDEDVTDANGIPRKSLAIIVDGGTNEAVAMAIYLKKNPGVGLYQAGTPVSVVVTSPTYPSNKKTIKFSRPINVVMTVDIVISNDGTLPENTEELIQDAIVEYANGTLIESGSGFKTTGFSIGDDVPLSQMYTPINKVIGSYGNSYVVSILLNGAAENTDITFNQISRWLTTNIHVTVV